MVDSRPCPAPSIEPLRLEQIFASPHQMRKHFDPAALKDLARSMKEEGLIQPITSGRSEAPMSWWSGNGVCGGPNA